jgi:hypothetical protein
VTRRSSPISLSQPQAAATTRADSDSRRWSTHAGLAICGPLVTGVIVPVNQSGIVRCRNATIRAVSMGRPALDWKHISENAPTIEHQCAMSPLRAPNSLRRKSFRRSMSRRTSMGMCGVGSPSRPRLRYIGVTLLLSIWERPQHSNEQRQAQLRLPGDRLANQPRPVDRPALIGANVRDSPNLGYMRKR